MKSSRIIYLILIFLSFVSCQKEKVEIPSYLIGEWKSVDDLSPVKLIIKSSGKLIYEIRAERGMEFKINEIESKLNSNHIRFHFHAKNLFPLKYTNSIVLRYYQNEDIVGINEHFLDSNNVLFIDKGIILKRTP
jgi:hypothetical protein